MANITITKPLSGTTQNITPHAEDSFVLDFNATDATLTRQDDDLVFSFEDGSKVTLSDFYTAFSADAMPSFVIEGVEISGQDFFATLSEELMPAAGSETSQVLSGGSGVDTISATLQGGLDSLGRLDQANTASISELSEADTTITTTATVAAQQRVVDREEENTEAKPETSDPVEVIPPKISVNIKDNDEGTVSKENLGGPDGDKVEITVTLEEGVEEGDRIVIEQNGNIVFDDVVTEDMLEDNLTLWVDPPAEDGNINVEATVTTPEGLEGKDEDSAYVDVIPPDASITIDSITDDNVINAAEAGEDVSITGTVGKDVKPGDIVTVTVGGQEFTGTVDSNLEYSIDVPGSLLAENSNIEASVTTSDKAGNTTTVDTATDYKVDTEIAADITIDSIADDNVINAAEAGDDVAITGTVGKDVQPGDTVTVTVGGKTFTGTVDSNLEYSIDVPGSLLAENGNIEASVSITDAAGNSTSASANTDYKVDTEISADITIDSITDDNVINAAEAGDDVAITGTVGKDVQPGDTVTVTVGGKTFTGTVDSNLEYSIDVPGSLLAENGNIEASVSITDAAGNSTSASADTDYKVDTEIAADITIDSIADDNVINAAEAGDDVAITGTVGKDVQPGDTVTVTVGGKTFTGTVDSNLEYSIDVPGSLLAENGNIEASVSITDAAGNSTTASANTDYKVDTEISADITIDSITDDNVINAAEAGDDVAITGTVGKDVQPGDTVTVTVGGKTFTGTVDSNLEYSIDVPGSLLAENGNIEASVSITDAAGNSTSASADTDYKVDTEISGDLDGTVTSYDDNMATNVVVESVTLPDDASYNFGDDFIVGDADNAFGVFSVDTGGNLVFTQNEAYQHDRNTDSDTMEVQIPVKDAAGNESFVTVSLTVVDSAPEVSKDSDTELTVDDNVATGQIEVDFGGDIDGASITMSGGGTLSYGATFNAESGRWEAIPPTANDNNPLNVETSYENGIHTIKIGDVTMTSTDNQNWDISYEHNDSTRDLTLKFTDGDGDFVRHTLETNDAPTVGTSSVTVVESALADGTDANSTAESARGHVDLDFGMDGQGSFAWDAESQPNITTTEGTEVVWSVQGDVLTGTADGKEVLSVTMEKDGDGNYTGDYTVDLKESIEHDAQGGDSSELNFNFTITDADGDSQKGFVSVEVEDDVTLAQDASIDLAPDADFGNSFFSGSVDSSSLQSALMPNEDAKPDFSYTGGGWDVQFYDNQSADKSTLDVGGFTISAAVVKYDAEEGHSVNQNTSGLELGWRVDNSSADGTDYANGLGLKGQGGSGDYEIGNIKGDYTSGVETEAIIISLPEGEVAYGVDLSFGCLFQAGGTSADSSDETITIEFFKDGELVYSVEQVRGTGDGDQNLDTSTITVPFDEVRIIPSVQGSDFVLTGVDFSDYNNMVVGQGSGQIEGGADGIADAYFESISVGDSSVEFTRDAQGNVSINGDNTVTLEDGTELTLTMNNGVVVAQDADGQNYFTATVDGDGNWTMYQHESFGDQINVNIGTVDGDGDTQNHNLTMTGNDAPSVGDVTAATVSEGDFIEGTTGMIPVTADGEVELDFGDDGQGTFAWNAEGQPSVSTSDGTEVTWSVEGDVLVGTANGEEVLSVTMQKDSDGNYTGEYTVTLSQPIEHNAEGQDSADLNFAFTVTDSDGQSTEGTVSVEVEDSAVSLTDAAENLHVTAGDSSAKFASDYFDEGAERDGGEFSVLGANGVTEAEDGTLTYDFDWGSVNMNPATGEYTVEGNGSGDGSFDVQFQDADGDSAQTTVQVENSIVVVDISIDSVRGFVDPANATADSGMVTVNGTVSTVDTTGESNTMTVTLEFDGVLYETEATPNGDGTYSYSVNIPSDAVIESGGEIHIAGDGIKTSVEITSDAGEPLANDTTTFSYSYFNKAADVDSIQGSDNVDIIEGMVVDTASYENKTNATNLGSAVGKEYHSDIDTAGGDDVLSFQSSGTHAYNVVSLNGNTVNLDTGTGDDEVSMHTYGTSATSGGTVGIKAQGDGAQNTVNLGAGDDNMEVVAGGVGPHKFAVVARDTTASSSTETINTVDLGTGNDNLYMEGEIEADGGINRIFGGEGDDTFIAVDGDNTPLTRHTFEATRATGVNEVDLGAGNDVMHIENSGTRGSSYGRVDNAINAEGDAISATDGGTNMFKMGEGEDTLTVDGDIFAYKNAENSIDMGTGDDNVTINGDMHAGDNSTNTVDLGAGNDTISIDGNLTADATSNNIIKGGEGDDTFTTTDFTAAAKAYLDGGEGYDAFVYETDGDTYIDFSQAGSIDIGGAEGVTINNFESITTGGGSDLINMGSNTDGQIDSGAGFDIVVADGGVTDTDMSEILQNSLNTEMFIFSNDQSVKDSTTTEEALNNLEGVTTSKNGEIGFGENWTEGESSMHNGTEYQAFTDENSETTILIAKTMLENVNT